MWHSAFGWKTISEGEIIIMVLLFLLNLHIGDISTSSEYNANNNNNNYISFIWIDCCVEWHKVREMEPN